MQAPWYFGSAQATLRHQRAQPEKQKQFSGLTDWYKKGVKDVSDVKQKTMILTYDLASKLIFLCFYLFASGANCYEVPQRRLRELRCDNAQKEGLSRGNLVIERSETLELL